MCCESVTLEHPKVSIERQYSFTLEHPILVLERRRIFQN
jgi:hypothetical protein